jgi:diguanylate cyclase (GGDEF)-like protein
MLDLEYIKHCRYCKEHPSGPNNNHRFSMARPPEVLLLSDTLQRVQVWARMLTSESIRLWQGPAGLDPNTAIDVIITDALVTGDMLPDPRSYSRLTCGEIGVILVGEEGTADVRLPVNVTARELQLACMLLTEVVRLRRQCRRDRQMQRVLHELAMRDPLTGLPNRRAWDDRLVGWESQIDDQSVTMPGSTNAVGVLCLAVIDLDHFKSINERFGHLTGDRVLGQVSRRLAENTSDDVFSARLGGDEFGLLFTTSDPSIAEGRVEQLRVSCCAQITPALTASSGVAFAGVGGDLKTSDIFHAADQALRQAKSDGRNRSITAVVAASVAALGRNPGRL